MTVQIMVILSIVLEPFVWLYSMKMKFEPQRQKVFYLGYIVLDIAVSLIDEFTYISEITGEIFFTLLFFVYAAGFICFMFNGKVVKKLLHIAILFIMSLASDFIVFVVMLIGGADMQQISGDSICNAIARLLSKLVMYILVRTVKRVKVDNILFPFVILAIVLELPSIIMFRLLNEKATYLIVYVISQAIAAVIIAYIVKLFRKKIFENEQHAEELEQKAVEYRNKAKILQDEAEELRKRAKRLEIEAREAKERAAEMEIQKDELETKINSNIPSMLEFFVNRKKMIFNIEEIMYFERMNRKVAIESSSLGRHEVNATIASLEKKLGERFVKINQGTLVNRNYIEKVDSKVCYMKNGREFYIARQRGKNIIDEL